MIKLNDTGLAVGEIKQLLATFNLPNCPIGKEKRSPNSHYIENDYIYLCLLDDNNLEVITEVFPYIYDMEYQNLTSKLKLDSMVYDRYTHRYLGNYLRFIRDYKNVNLMSLYNCFDGELLHSSLSFTDVTGKKRTFDKKDKNYIIYSIPINFANYTLGVQSLQHVEMCISIENPPTNISESLIRSIAKLTYRKYKINKTILLEDLFTKYIDHPVYGPEWNTCLSLLKEQLTKIRLYLKVPKTINSSITLLEGLYSSSKVGANDIPERPQLLSYQNNISYLLSDKMMLYLSGNAITPISEDYDIRKLQAYLSHHYNFSLKSGIWTKNTTLAIKKIIQDNKLWETEYDVLPYCDSCIENLTKGEIV